MNHGKYLMFCHGGRNRKKVPILSTMAWDILTPLYTNTSAFYSSLQKYIFCRWQSFDALGDGCLLKGLVRCRKTHTRKSYSGWRIWTRRGWRIEKHQSFLYTLYEMSTRVLLCIRDECYVHCICDEQCIWFFHINKIICHFALQKNL